MKKIFVFIIVLFLLNLMLFSNVNVSADTGPKPFLSIEVMNLPQSDYIAGLLMENEYCGPNISFNEDSVAEDFQNDDYALLSKVYSKISSNEKYYLSSLIKEYKDADSLTFYVGYYPPESFKLYIYNQITDEIYISHIYETYAFSSYYKCDFNGSLELIQSNNELLLSKDYNYIKEVALFLLRVVITLVLEIGIALLFKFDKKSIFIILYTNIGTQLLLNIGLNLFVYNYGKNVFSAIPLLIFGELLVFVIEIIIFRLFCKRSNGSKKLIIIYTISANLLSLFMSFIMWLI